MAGAGVRVSAGGGRQEAHLEVVDSVVSDVEVHALEEVQRDAAGRHGKPVRVGGASGEAVVRAATVLQQACRPAELRCGLAGSYVRRRVAGQAPTSELLLLDHHQWHNR